MRITNCMNGRFKWPITEKSSRDYVSVSRRSNVFQGATIVVVQSLLLRRKCRACQWSLMPIMRRRYMTWAAYTWDPMVAKHTRSARWFADCLVRHLKWPAQTVVVRNTWLSLRLNAKSITTLLTHGRFWCEQRRVLISVERRVAIWLKGLGSD